MLETRILFHVTLLFLLNLRSTKGDCYTRWPSCGNEENIVCTTNYGQTVANCEIIYNDPEIRYHMMICNYGPRGLRVTRPLGKIGRPCTKCPEEMSCNAEYEGLCGDIDESHYYITVDGAVSTFCSGAYIWLTMICFVGFAVSM
nr:unnamed protein product [Callosobruchus analis]